MRKLIRALLIALLLLLTTGCNSKIWNEGLFGRQVEDTWTVTLHMDYDGDGDIDTVIYHYTLYTNGDIEVWEEVID